MPITCPIAIRDLTPAEFDAVDSVVMRHAYDCQNELGRLCDERAYENDLALRLHEAGCEVHTRVPLHVAHENFAKTYRVDLVCNHGIYDAKAVLALTGEHDAQVLHYAMLLDVRHVKLLNFRPAKVQGRLQFNDLTTAKRLCFETGASLWQPLSDHCLPLRQRFAELLADWGAFLDYRLYEEALVHFFGGEMACVRRIDLTRDGSAIGTHRIQQHAPELCFLVSAVTKDLPAYQSHLQRLLKLTGLRGMQWMNLCHHQIQLITLTGDGKRVGTSE